MGIRRSAPRRISPRQRKRQRALKAKEPRIFARDGYRCAVRISPACTGRAETMHHVIKRSAGLKAEVLDRDENLLSSCGECNGYVETHPAEAIAMKVARSRFTPTIPGDDFKAAGW